MMTKIFSAPIKTTAEDAKDANRIGKALFDQRFGNDIKSHDPKKVAAIMYMETKLQEAGGSPGVAMWRNAPYKTLTYEFYTNWLIPNLEGDQKVVIPSHGEYPVCYEYVHYERTGGEMRELFQFMHDTHAPKGSVFPSMNVLHAARLAAEGNAELKLPCEVYLAQGLKRKKLGVLISAAMFRSYMAFQSMTFREEESQTQAESFLGDVQVVLAAQSNVQNTVAGFMKSIKEFDKYLQKLVDNQNAILFHGIPMAQAAFNPDVAPPLAAVLIPYQKMQWLGDTSKNGEPTFHEMFTAVLQDDFPQGAGEWVDFIAERWTKLHPDDASSVKEDAGQTMPLGQPLAEEIPAEETPVQEPEDGANLIPIVPEKEREAYEVGYRQWLRYDVRAFLFNTEVYPTQTGVEPYTARMIHGKAAGEVVYVYETALQIFMDEHGQFLRKVVGFLENPNSHRKVSYQHLVGGLMQGQHPDEHLYRVRHNMDNLGYYMSMPYYKSLLALMGWVSDTFGLPPHVEKLLRASGLVSDNPKEMRHETLKNIRQQNVNELMTAGVCGIAVANHAGERIALTGVIIPARKMRLLKDALLSRIPDFFDRVRAEDIPEGPGTAWMEYLGRVLNGAGETAPALEALTPAEEIPAEVVTIEEVPIKDVFNRLFDGKVVDQNLRDALERDLQRIVLKEPEMVPVEGGPLQEVPKKERVNALTEEQRNWQAWGNSKLRPYRFNFTTHKTGKEMLGDITPTMLMPFQKDGRSSFFAEINLRVYWDVDGEMVREVWRFLAKGVDDGIHPFADVIDPVARGEMLTTIMPKKLVWTKPVGYVMGVGFYKGLLALLSYLGSRFSSVRDEDFNFLEIVGNHADRPRQVRKGALTLLGQEATDGYPSPSVGITRADHTQNFSLMAVIVPLSSYQLLRERLMEHIPALFERVHEQRIPQDVGRSWTGYLDSVLIGGQPLRAAPVYELPLQEAGVVEPDAVEDVVEVETPVERKVRQRRERVAKLRPEAILAGMDADTLWEEVLTNPSRYFACEVEGPARMTPELRALMREGKAEPAIAKEGTTQRYTRPVELETAIARSKLAVMEWQHFVSTVDSRRHPAKRWLEGLLGRELNFHKADVVDITPDRIGELPGLVAGLHRNYPDRLCVVRVVMRHKVTRYTCVERAERRLKRRGKSPMVIKTRQISATRLHRQKFLYAEVPMLAVFPAGWMAAVAEPWMPGLFGTPYDPTLLDFCGTLPKEWWAELAKVIPAKDETLPVLDVRALRSSP